MAAPTTPPTDTTTIQPDSLDANKFWIGADRGGTKQWVPLPSSIAEQLYTDKATADPGHGITVGDWFYLDNTSKPVKATNADTKPAALECVAVTGNVITYRYRRIVVPGLSWNIEEVDDGAGTGTTEIVSGSNDRYAWLSSTGAYSHAIPATEYRQQVAYYVKDNPLVAGEAWLADVRPMVLFPAVGEALVPASWPTYDNDGDAIADVGLASGAAYVLFNGVSYEPRRKP